MVCPDLGLTHITKHKALSEGSLLANTSEWVVWERIVAKVVELKQHCFHLLAVSCGVYQKQEQ